jgi:glycosyltransferase involved in cell wall biosynthesis
MLSFKIVDTVIAVDYENKEYYEKKYPFAKEKIIIVPVGIDTKKFIPLPKTKILKELGLTSKKKIFLFVGRLSKEKRIDMMIKNIKQDETLIIVGSGELETELKKLVGKKDVLFVGAKNPAQLVKYYTVADALLLFSTHEGLPTVALEAFSCGTPVISTKVGEMPHLIKEGKTGYLVNESNYRKAMDSLSSKNMSKECRLLAVDYDWKNVVKRLEKEVYS